MYMHMYIHVTIMPYTGSVQWLFHTCRLREWSTLGCGKSMSTDELRYSYFYTYTYICTKENLHVVVHTIVQTRRGTLKHLSWYTKCSTKVLHSWCTTESITKLKQLMLNTRCGNNHYISNTSLLRYCMFSDSPLQLRATHIL